MQYIICLILLSKSLSYIKGCEAVPTKDVFASLAHHLRAASIPLYRDSAHGAPLDVLPLHLADPHGQVAHLPALLHQEGPVLSTGEAGVPGGGAEAAELLDTGGTGDGHPLGLGAAGTDVADGVAASTGAPRPVGVQRDLWRETRF